MTVPLMPKATAVWFIENTTLTFDQVADFCGLHPLEVQGIADGDVAAGLIGEDPVATGQLNREELEKAIADESYRMKMIADMDEYIQSQKKKKARYTPVARRQDKPDAIAWFVKHHPEIADAQIVKLIGTTKNTIKNIKERTHWNINNIKPRDPVLLGLCTQTDLTAAIKKAEKAEENRIKREEKAAAKAKKEKEAAKAEEKPEIEATPKDEPAPAPAAEEKPTEPEDPTEALAKALETSMMGGSDETEETPAAEESAPEEVPAETVDSEDSEKEAQENA